MSPSTWSLKTVGTTAEGMAVTCGFCHSLHIRQVSQMLGMSLKMSNGMPAAFNVRVMTADEACHHLKWSLRNKCLASPSVATRRARKLFLRSNRVQSVGVSPVAESLVSCRSGSRRSPVTLLVLAGGARGGASPRGVAAEG